MLRYLISTIFAVSVSIILGVLAFLPEIEMQGLFLFLITMILITIALIIYLLIPKITDDTIFILKTSLTVFSTIDFLYVARFFSFYYGNQKSIYLAIDAFKWLWYIGIICGIILGILAFEEHRVNKSKKHHWVLLIIAIIVLLLSVYLLMYGTSLLEGVVTTKMSENAALLENGGVIL